MGCPTRPSTVRVYHFRHFGTAGLIVASPGRGPADARYAIGKFDGKTFTTEHEGKHQVHYGSYYASQTFDNAPDGRKIQIGWVRLAMPGMPFNQTFSFPHDLTLRATDDGIRMYAKPVKEIERIHAQKHAAKSYRRRPVPPPRTGRVVDSLVFFND